MKGEELKEKIRLSGRRFNEVADAMGITPQALQKIFGSDDVKTSTIERVAKVLGKPEAKEIIEKYRGSKHLLNVADGCTNYRSFALRLNKNLSDIMPGLTAYWARHSWATIAASLDIPEDTIALALGHSSAHTTTAIYIQRDLRKVDAANRKVIDFVLNKKPDAK